MLFPFEIDFNGFSRLALNHFPPVPLRRSHLDDRCFGLNALFGELHERLVIDRCLDRGDEGGGRVLGLRERDGHWRDDPSLHGIGHNIVILFILIRDYVYVFNHRNGSITRALLLIFRLLVCLEV